MSETIRGRCVKSIVCDAMGAGPHLANVWMNELQPDPRLILSTPGTDAVRKNLYLRRLCTQMIFIDRLLTGRNTESFPLE